MRFVLLAMHFAKLATRKYIVFRVSVVNLNRARVEPLDKNRDAVREISENVR